MCKPNGGATIDSLEDLYNMAVLKQHLRSLLLSASVSIHGVSGMGTELLHDDGKVSNGDAAMGASSEKTMTMQETSNLLTAVMVGLVLMVIGVGLVGYSLVNATGTNREGEQEVLEQKDGPILVENSESSVESEPSLATEVDEPKLRRSPRLREKAAKKYN